MARNDKARYSVREAASGIAAWVGRLEETNDRLSLSPEEQRHLAPSVAALLRLLGTDAAATELEQVFELWP